MEANNTSSPQYMCHLRRLLHVTKFASYWHFKSCKNFETNYIENNNRAKQITWDVFRTLNTRGKSMHVENG